MHYFTYFINFLHCNINCIKQNCAIRERYVGAMTNLRTSHLYVIIEQMHKYITGVLVEVYITNEFLSKHHERNLLTAFFMYEETPGVRAYRNAPILALPTLVTRYQAALDAAKAEQNSLQSLSVTSATAVSNALDVDDVEVASENTSINIDIPSSNTSTNNKVVLNIEALKQYACKVVDIDEITYQR